MDPGLGLVVNSIVPNEVEVPKAPLKLPPGFLDKSHVRHALKYMPDDEHREKTLEVAMAWKKKFAAERWKPVVDAIVAASKEDSIRTSSQDVRLQELQANKHFAERSRTMTTASAPAIFQKPSQQSPLRAELEYAATAVLPLRHTLASSTPRLYRWDVMPNGPVTPLSPTPMGNSFTRNGYWQKSTSRTKQLEPLTPRTDVEYRLSPPFVPTDPVARAVYNKLKDEIGGIARKYCLARHDMHPSIGDNDFVPATMIRSKDLVSAAHVVLHHRRTKLKTVVAKDIPGKLRAFAAEEAALRHRLCIKNETDLFEQYEWMNHETFSKYADNLGTEDYEVPVHLAVTMLDEQREALRAFRTQHKDNDLQLTKVALESAWAVRILEDAERLKAFEDDESSSDGADDDGYSYGNFLRSIKSEMSTSTSSGTLASMVDELSNSHLTALRSRANTHQTVGSSRSRESRFPDRLSTSPTKAIPWPSCSSDSSAPSINCKHSNSLCRCTDLRISTIAVDQSSCEGLSPQDREFRHRAPDLTDLNDWAAELKKMEAMRLDRRRSPTLHRRGPGRTNGWSGSAPQRSPTKQVSVDSINTRISPPRPLHSRFSSTSSDSTELSQPLLRPSLQSQGDIASLATFIPTMLDHQYHQRNISKATTSHQRDLSKSSMHDSLRGFQHLRSTSNVKVLERASSKMEQDEWTRELKRMESRERVRQGQERKRASQALDGGGVHRKDDEDLQTG